MEHAGRLRPWPGGTSAPDRLCGRPRRESCVRYVKNKRRTSFEGARAPPPAGSGARDKRPLFFASLPENILSFSCKRMDGMPACAAFTNSHFTTMCEHFKNCLIFKKRFFDFKSLHGTESGGRTSDKRRRPADGDIPGKNAKKRRNTENTEAFPAFSRKKAEAGSHIKTRFFHIVFCAFSTRDGRKVPVSPRRDTQIFTVFDLKTDLPDNDGEYFRSSHSFPEKSCETVVLRRKMFPQTHRLALSGAVLAALLFRLKGKKIKTSGKKT